MSHGSQRASASRLKCETITVCPCFIPCLGGLRGSSGARGPPSATLCKFSVSDTTRVAPVECNVRWVVRVHSLCTSSCGNRAFFYVSGGSIDHSRVLKLSLSACSHPQRAWEGPQGSLTTVSCKYLRQHTTSLPRSSLSNPIWLYMYLAPTHRNAPLPIIPQTDVSCQVCH
jgi:hypothetical protein